MRWLTAALLAAIVAAGMPGSRVGAADRNLIWIVTSISQVEDGDLISSSTPQLPRPGSALITGQQISTGNGQAVTLLNGRDLVELRPNSTIVIGDSDAATTKIDLISGTIHVELREFVPGENFSVSTPYLVATVKDAKFDVATSSTESRVTVMEGEAAVSAIGSDSSVTITAGYLGVIGRQPPPKWQQ